MEITILLIISILSIFHIINSQNYTELQDEPYYFLIENEGRFGSYTKNDMGFANGYVRISKNHPWYNKSYIPSFDKLDEEYDNSPSCIINVHGGITYSGYIRRSDEYVFGFDTLHYNDTIETCSKEYVEKECQSMMDQLKKIK
jgi:hypothetical protein